MVAPLAMNLAIRINLATRYTLAAGAALAAVYVGLAASESAAARRQALADIFSAGRALAAIHSPNLVEALTSADDVVLLRSLEALTALPFVVSAAVVDARGREFTRGPAAAGDPEGRDVALLSPLSRGATRAGMLRLNLSGRAAGAAAADTIQRAWARAGLSWAVGTGLVWFAIRRLLRRVNRLPESLPRDGKPGPWDDELSAPARRIRRMLDDAAAGTADALAGAAGTRALLAAIPAAVPLQMLVTDQNHRVVAASATFRSRWLSGSDAAGRHVSEILPRGPLSEAARDCAREPGTLVRRRLDPAGDLTALAVGETGQGIAGMVLVIDARAPATEGGPA